jgi:hypothetical protein
MGREVLEQIEKPNLGRCFPGNRSVAEFGGQQRSKHARHTTLKKRRTLDPSSSPSANPSESD